MAKDPIEQYIIDRNRRDTLARAGITRDAINRIKDPVIAAEKLKDYEDQILSLDDFDSLPGESPLRDIGRIPSYREAHALHGKDWR